MKTSIELFLQTLKFHGCCCCSTISWQAAAGHQLAYRMVHLLACPPSVAAKMMADRNCRQVSILWLTKRNCA